VVRIPPDFISLLGLSQALTPSRNNGFLNMFKLMQKKALELYMDQQKAEKQQQQEEGNSGATGSSAAAPASWAAEASSPSAAPSAREPPASSSFTPVKDSMRRKLEGRLSPLRLTITDESYKHAGHAGVKDLGSGGETHFTMEIVSAAFEGLTSLKRHRLVYGVLDEEMGQGPVHALSLVTKTPAEAGL
jgi:BolA-like protein 1